MDDEILQKIEDLKVDIEKLPNCRERALVITNLDNARVWYKEMKEILAKETK